MMWGEAENDVIPPLAMVTRFYTCSGYSNEHLVSDGAVVKTDGIGAAWRNNFSSLTGLLMPKSLIISLMHLPFPRKL